MKCKFCMEDIQDGAIKCKHCGSELNTEPKIKEETNTVSEMKFCSGCGKKIHKTSTSCPHCGSQQTDALNKKKEPRKIAYSIISLIFGIFIFLSLLGDSFSSKDAINGGFFFCVVGIIFGVVPIAKKYSGKGMAITGLVLSIISFFALMGMLSKLSG